MARIVPLAAKRHLPAEEALAQIRTHQLLLPPTPPVTHGAVVPLSLRGNAQSVTIPLSITVTLNDNATGHRRDRRSECHD